LIVTRLATKLQESEEQPATRVTRAKASTSQGSTRSEPEVWIDNAVRIGVGHAGLREAELSSLLVALEQRQADEGYLSDDSKAKKLVIVMELRQLKKDKTAAAKSKKTLSPPDAEDAEEHARKRKQPPPSRWEGTKSQCIEKHKYKQRWKINCNTLVRNPNGGVVRKKLLLRCVAPGSRVRAPVVQVGQCESLCDLSCLHSKVV
jgi:hypothetical protein